VARPKKAKQRREPESIAQRLDEIQSVGDRITEWIAGNPAIVLSVAAAIVVLAAGWGLAGAARENAREEASAALGATQADYRRAMGASADDVLVAEPANPETARRVREEFQARFGEVLAEHSGTTAAALAGLELGELEEALGKPDEALATWQRAAAELGPEHVVAALLELRIAAVHEAKGRWLEAGEAFERAAGVVDFPLRHTARAEAARCFAEAGEVERALAAFERVKSEDPDAFLPEHLNARLLELRAAQRLN
jgi:tetratricopeptide (TPR) repeat protein